MRKVKFLVVLFVSLLVLKTNCLAEVKSSGEYIFDFSYAFDDGVNLSWGKKVGVAIDVYCSLYPNEWTKIYSNMDSNEVFIDQYFIWGRSWWESSNLTAYPKYLKIKLVAKKNSSEVQTKIYDLSDYSNPISVRKCISSKDGSLISIMQYVHKDNDDGELCFVMDDTGISYEVWRRHYYLASTDIGDLDNEYNVFTSKKVSYNFSNEVDAVNRVSLLKEESFDDVMPWTQRQTSTKLKYEIYYNGALCVNEPAKYDKQEIPNPDNLEEILLTKYVARRPKLTTYHPNKLGATIKKGEFIPEVFVTNDVSKLQPSYFSAWYKSIS